jgi:UDP-glucose 4-epimerase
MMVIVTGGAGFIGSHIVDELVHQDHQVKMINSLATGTLTNPSGVMGQIERVLGDIADRELLRREFVWFDYILHQLQLDHHPAISTIS